MSGNNLTQGTGSKQPTYIGADSDFNGYPSIHFPNSGAFEKMNTGAFTEGDLAQPNTIFIVAKIGVAVNGLITDGISVDSKRHAVFVDASNDNALFANNSVAGSAADTSVHIYATRFNSGSGGNSELFLDGGVADISADAGNAPWNGLTLGSRYTDDFHINVKVARLLAYNSLLSDGDFNAVGNALATAYGTTWTDI